jgi:hypothetical protein
LLARPRNARLDLLVVLVNRALNARERLFVGKALVDEGERVKRRAVELGRS